MWTNLFILISTLIILYALAKIYDILLAIIFDMKQIMEGFSILSGNQIELACWLLDLLKGNIRNAKLVPIRVEEKKNGLQKETN